MLQRWSSSSSSGGGSSGSSGAESNMSRRKQAKPQQLRSEHEDPVSGLAPIHGVLGVLDKPETYGRIPGGEDTHVCDRCCAEFFTWTELSDHQRLCTEEPLVLIVKDSEGTPALEDTPPTEDSPAPRPSPVPSVSSGASESTFFDLGETLVNDVSMDRGQEEEEEEEEEEREDGMELEPRPQEDSAPGRAVVAAADGVPSTNVTLEILHSTRVAVAQFSQGIGGIGGGGGGTGGKAAAAIPVILEHLLALQQQQVHQLQLIEQICSQVAVMNRQPTQAALNPASRSLSLGPNPFPSQGTAPTPILPLSGTVPSTVNGQAAVSMPQSVSHSQNASSASSEPLSRTTSSSGGGMSTLSPPFTSSISCSQTLSSSSPLPLGPSSSSSSSLLLSSPSSLPFLPQSPPGSVIFPNPLASIAATASALDPLAALVKHRKGKLSSMFETKPGPDEPFFKHKCRFCAKVFGSDSALQIHLRSHTGERPFKCNICGNRFSTKGNLKVHFQRHKDKYPHVQMNPYPVPEYLDNVPTNSGIPYGMSIPPEKPVTSWLDNKPVTATLGLPLSSSLPGIGGSNDPVSVTPSVRSPFQLSPGECVSLSPDHRGGEARFSPVSEPLDTEASNALRAEGVHLPQSCSLRPRPTLVTEPTTSAIPPGATSPEPFPLASPVPSSPPLSLNFEESKFQPSSLLDSMQTSETSKLQQLVENIDKKITDPNQCALCHRVLSCQSALKMHYRIHTGERPFKCKVCGRAFTTKGNLKTHVGVHRENPPVLVQHSCPICQKRFTNAVVLQQHIRMHMVGPTADAAHWDGLQDMDDVSINGKSFDSLSSIDDVSMEDDLEDEEMEELREDASPSKPSVSDGDMSPKSFSIVSTIAALENQMRMIDSTVNLNHSFALKPLTNGHTEGSHLNIKYTLSEKRLGNSGGSSPNVSESSSSPVQSGTEEIKASALRTNRLESRESLAELVKRERSQSPNGSLDRRGLHPGVKEESPYSLSFQLSRDRGLPVPMPSPIVKTEINGHSKPNPAPEGPFSVHIPPAYPSAASPAMTSLLGPAPPRRTARQHNCNVCGKNFSSASALQIHERTHTGEKPFVCSICGRAFTTKGNLKVHMGTHMWNNAPARRGRRLSVENPMALLGSEAVKFGDVFQKDLANRAMNLDPGFWNRYATAISNSLAMKNNEISVIQNRGGVAQLHPLSAGMDRNPVAGLTKSGMDRHFSMLIDDSKEIGIN